LDDPSRHWEGFGMLRRCSSQSVTMKSKSPASQKEAAPGLGGGLHPFLSGYEAGSSFIKMLFFCALPVA
jgi:hypothetical protein